MRQGFLNQGLLISLARVLLLLTVHAVASFAQGVNVTADSATSDNLFVQFNANDPERVDVIKWNPAGLSGSEQNLTNSGTTGTGPCFNGDVEYFGNSWAPPDPPTGKVLVGAGTGGVRVPGPDSKLVINSVATGCPQNVADVAVNTIYKFWQGGEAANKMRVTRSFTFDAVFNSDFRPFIPRFYPISAYSQVLHPDAAGLILVTENVGGATCPFGCTVTNWNAADESLSWFAVHDPISGRGVVVRHKPNAATTVLWVDWDGASSTTSSSVLLRKPTGGFSGEVVETETLCFYDSTRWIPSLTLPPGC